jgi:hypothetical protein
MPTSIPSLKLDDKGVCNFCRNYENIFRNWKEIKDNRKKQFEKLIKKIKNLNRPYDVVVPLSGGKDSVYVLYLCSKIYNLKCLCVTFVNGWLSDDARKNIENAINATDSDHIYYTMNRNIMLKLYKLFLQKTSTFCPACMAGIAIATGIAQKSFNVPMIVSGTGMRYSYRGFIPEIFQGGDLNFFKNVIKDEEIKKKIGTKMMGFKSSSFFEKMMHAIPQILKIPDPFIPKYLRIYDYIDASYDEIYNTIIEEMDWNKNLGYKEHMDCIVSKLPKYIDSQKFPDMTEMTCKNSSLIRLGLMDRQEAMEYEEKNNRNIKEPEILNHFLSEINMEKSEFKNAISNWKNVEKYRSKNITDNLQNLFQKITGWH